MRLLAIRINKNTLDLVTKLNGGVVPSMEEIKNHYYLLSPTEGLDSHHNEIVHESLFIKMYPDASLRLAVQTLE